MKVLGMFKQGGKLRDRPAAAPSAGAAPGTSENGSKAGAGGRGGGAGGQGRSQAGAGSAVERQVVNCLGCGKIYDCRQRPNEILPQDVLSFIGAVLCCAMLWCGCPGRGEGAGSWLVMVAYRLRC